MITAGDREKYPHHSDSSILGIKLVGGLTDDALQLWLADQVEEHPVFQALMILLTAGDHVVNPWWLTTRLADEAYNRSLIDEKTFDMIVR